MGILNVFQQVLVLVILPAYFRTAISVTAQVQQCKSLPEKKNPVTLNNFSMDYILATGIAEMEGKAVINKISSPANNQAIFVLGNTGSGKTTATQIIAGDLSRLYATRSAGSLVIIDDDNRIGAPSTTSKTLVPDFVVDPNSGDAFWDCPGFNDNRGSKTDIAAMYFLKHALDSTHSAKFLITTTHSSLKPGNRIDFPLLSSHLVNLFADIEKFSNSIGLLVTRVASFDPETGEDLTDDILLEQTLEFLQDLVVDLKQDEERHSKETEGEKINEIQNKIKFVNNLLKDGFNNTAKIFFLRGPRRCGALSTVPQVWETRKKVAQQYKDSLAYSPITPFDFRYSVQESTLRDVEQVYIPQLVESITEIVNEAVTDWGAKFFAIFHEEFVDRFEDKPRILSFLEKGLIAIRKYLENENSSNMLGTRLAMLHVDLLPNSQFTTATKLEQLEKQLDFFLTFITKTYDTSSAWTNWSSSVIFLQNDILTLQKFYKFCNLVEELINRKKSQQDLRVYLRRNGFSLKASNVFTLLESTNILQIGSDIKQIWNTNLGFGDKSYFLKLIENSLPKLHDCIPIPTVQGDENRSNRPSLETILSKGIEEMETEVARGPQFSTTDRQAIFVLGNSGSGKTTATQIMAGSLNHLHATFAEGSTLVILDNDNKIGAPTTRSKTLVPNYVVEPNNSGNVFWDCPGFQDNRGPEADIAAMYFLKHALTLTNYAKFLFTVPQSSVTIGNVRDDFDTLVTHGIRLIRNVEKYNLSIGLVVTKVASYSNLGYIDDNEILNRTLGFLLNYKNDLVALIESTENGKRNSESKDKLTFAENIINNVDGFLKPHIAFIRSPIDCGPLDTMEEILDSRKRLNKFYNDDLSYAPIDSKNFNISLSADTMYQVVNNISQTVSLTIEEYTCAIVENHRKEFLKTFYKTLFTNSNVSVNFLYNMHTDLTKFLDSTSNGLTNASYTSTLKTFHRQLENEFSCSTFANISSLEAQLKFYREVSSEDANLPQPNPSTFKCYLDFLETLSVYSEFYNFCNSTYAQLREYENQDKMQKLVDKNQVNFDEKTSLNFLFANNLIKGVTFLKANTTWSRMEMNDKLYFAEVIRQAIPRIKLECQQSKVGSKKKLLVITGRLVTISRAFNKVLWSQASCQPDIVKELQIVALETIFFDKDILEKGNELLLSIIAPVWEVKLFLANKRQIILDGSDGTYIQKPPSIPFYVSSFVFSRINDGTLGPSGKTGNPGGNAGSFFGIVEYILNKDKLFITTNGGNGGQGQEGADGGDGHPGRDATWDDFPSAYAISDKLWAGEWKNGKLENGQVKGNFIHYTQIWYTAKGQTGGEGGRGGNGGNGGAPGARGRIQIIFTEPGSGINSNQLSTLSGKGGPAGLGGKGGKGGKDGNHYSCLRRGVTLYVWTWASCSTRNVHTNARQGHTGSKGIAATQTSAVTPLYEPWHIIMQYKKISFGMFSSPEFAIKLERLPYLQNNNFQISSIMSFAEELQQMEEMFYRTHSDASFNRTLFHAYYEDFGSRTQKFSQSARQLSDGNKYALNLIYTAALGKLADLRRFDFQLNIVKTKPYLDTIVKKINLLKTAQRDKEIEDQAVEFSNKFLDAINEASVHIENTVQPAIEECQKHVEKANYELHDEIQQFLENAKADVEQQKELKRKAERAAVLRTIMGVVGIASAATQFLGPACLAVGTIVSTGTSIAQSLAFGPTSQRPSLKIPPSVVGTLTSANKAYYENEIKSIRKISSAVLTATNEVDNDKLEYLKLNAIKLNSLVTRVEIGVENNNFIDTARAKREADELARRMKQAVFDESQKLANAEKTEQRNAAIIRNLVVSMNTADAVTQTILDHQSSTSKIKELSDAVKQAEEQVKLLEAKKEQFYDEFLPAMESMFNAIETDTKSFEGISRVAQMVKGWEMKTMLRKMRHYIKQFTTGISVSEEFQVCLDLLDEALTLLLGLYDQMENFKDKIDLANYIANVNKANTKSTGNIELDKVLSKVSIIVQSNLILEEYQKAKHAFKQWVFPFASHYLYDRHAIYGKLTNLNDVVNLYTNEIEHFQSELEIYQTATVSRDISLIFEVFSSDTVSSEPFYRWDNENWQETIKKLLSGEPIKLKADVDMRRQINAGYFQHKSAIKFKTIELKFRARNESIQTELDEKSKYFRMRLQHSDHSLCKTLGKHYIISSKPQTYLYSFEKNHKGHVSRNGVQYKVQGADIDYMLSPYTWWVIQLIDSKPDDHVGFLELSKFGNEIDLELEGEGVYLDENTANKDMLEKLNIDEHYDSIDPKLIDVQEQDLYGVC